MSGTWLHQVCSTHALPGRKQLPVAAVVSDRDRARRHRRGSLRSRQVGAQHRNGSLARLQPRGAPPRPAVWAAAVKTGDEDEGKAPAGDEAATDAEAGGDGDDDAEDETEPQKTLEELEQERERAVKRKIESIEFKDQCEADAQMFAEQSLAAQEAYDFADSVLKAAEQALEKAVEVEEIAKAAVEEGMPDDAPEVQAFAAAAKRLDELRSEVGAAQLACDDCAESLAEAEKKTSNAMLKAELAVSQEAAALRSCDELDKIIDDVTKVDDSEEGAGSASAAVPPALVEDVLKSVDGADGAASPAPAPAAESAATVAALSSADEALSSADLADMPSSEKEEQEKKEPVVRRTATSSQYMAAPLMSGKGDTVENDLQNLKRFTKKVLKKAVVVLIVAATTIFAGMTASKRFGWSLPSLPSTATSTGVGSLKGLERGIAFVGESANKVTQYLSTDTGKEGEHGHDDGGIVDVIVLLATACVAVPLIQRVPGGSPILGFLIGGAIIGPNGVGIISHVNAVKELAEFGVVFLLFNIGLELSLERLQSMAKYVFGLGMVQVCVSIALVYALIPVLLPASLIASASSTGIVIGGALALSSTAVAMQVLGDRGETTERHGRITFSVLLFQDLAVVVLLMLVPLLAPQAPGAAGGSNAIGEALVKAGVRAVLCITAIIAGGRVLLRPIFNRMAGGNTPAELFAALTLLVAIGTSAITQAAGLSMALGAFLAGLLIAETEYVMQVESDIAPFRGLLLGLFFMTVGMEVQPGILLNDGLWVLGGLAILLGLKSLVMIVGGALFGLSVFTGLRASMFLAPGGEFAFVLLGESVRNAIVSKSLAEHLYLVVALSMALTPWLAAAGSMISKRFEKSDSKKFQVTTTDTDDMKGHVILAGYGRVGQLIAQLLKEKLIPFVCLELRPERVAEGRARGHNVYFGDAGSEQVLHSVGAHRAACAVVTLDTASANYRTVWALKKGYPNVKSFVRAFDVQHGLVLEKAGATAVVPETLEPSLQLASAVLTELKMPSTEVVTTVDDFRRNHMEELMTLAMSGGGGMGYSTTNSPPPPNLEDALEAVEVTMKGKKL
ncbi:K(+) efflux antiporter 2 [Pycnococcus provasolii]